MNLIDWPLADKNSEDNAPAILVGPHYWALLSLARFQSAGL
jgi:hypothetical protein